MHLTPEQARFVSGYQIPAPHPAPKPAIAPVPPATPVIAQPDPGRHVSSAARDAYGLAKISQQCRDVMDVIRIAHQHGTPDLTGRELRSWWQKVNVGKDIDTSSVSGRINELISAGLLERLPRRLCTISGVPAGPVRAVYQQKRLVA